MKSNSLPALQLHLGLPLRTVVGNVDYLHWREQLERIAALLVDSGLEDRFAASYLAHYQEERQQRAARQGRPVKPLSGRRLARLRKYAIQALRCNVARLLADDPYRPFSVRLADSPVLQWFCLIDELDQVRVPGKSTLERFDKIVPEPEIRQLIQDLIRLAAAPQVGAEALHLAAPVALDNLFADTTCVKANIHFPVDWVLLRDATRTLMLAVRLIRQHGLRERMEEPASFLHRINHLAMQMTQARRKKGAAKARKQTLRQMKRLSRIIGAHARRHRDRLEADWAKTDLSQRQAARIVGRIDEVLEKLPQAIRQAHERLIGERQVPNAEKLLSLYEDDLHVIVRGKAGAEVEFGNSLLLCEQQDGLIVDWELLREQAPADNNLLPRLVARLEAVFGAPALQGCGLSTDRGFHSARNERLLESHGMYDALCPRDPHRLAKRREEERFCQLQRRRAQTEGRIGLFKNDFLGGLIRSKGFDHRHQTIAWAVLAHNLWVIARLPTAQAQSDRRRDAA